MIEDLLLRECTEQGGLMGHAPSFISTWGPVNVISENAWVRMGLGPTWERPRAGTLRAA